MRSFGLAGGGGGVEVAFFRWGETVLFLWLFLLVESYSEKAYLRISLLLFKLSIKQVGI